jgi:hypothetical protein
LHPAAVPVEHTQQLTVASPFDLRNEFVHVSIRLVRQWMRIVARSAPSSRRTTSAIHRAPQHHEPSG